LIPDDTGSDLIPTESFRSNWRQRIEHLRDRDRTEFFGLLLNTDPDVLVVDEDEDESTLTVTNESTTIGTWPSDAALIADVAALTLGEHVPRWNELSGQSVTNSRPDYVSSLTRTRSAMVRSR
jgi:hypothetical protein